MYVTVPFMSSIDTFCSIAFSGDTILPNVNTYQSNARLKECFYMSFRKNLLSLRHKTIINKPMRKLLLLFVILIQSLCAATAQTYTIKNIGIREGLSNGFVDDMVIDSQGFVWVATESGLNRIAGNLCTVFKTENSSISNNSHVGLLYHPGSNTVWIHSKDGRVDMYNCKTQRITPYKIDGNNLVSVADICMAADSGIWLAHYNGELRHYDPITHKSFVIKRSLLPKFDNGVRSIMDDGKGNLYIGLRMDGMVVYNTRTRKSRMFVQDDNDPTSLPGNNVRSVFVDHLQNVWVGTNLGLGLFDPVKGKFRVFRHVKGDSKSLAGDNIHQIIETRDKTLWIASDIGGISRLDLNRFQHPAYGEVEFSQMTMENSGLSSNNTRRIIEDNFGNMWVANYSTGVDFMTHYTSNFQTLSMLGQPLTNISAVYVDNKENLWIGQDNTVSMYRGGMVVRTWDFSHYIGNSSSSAYLFREDHDGNIWFGTSDNGLLKLNPLTGIISTIKCTRGLDVNALCVDHTGRVWAGAENGVYSIYGGEERKEDAINGIMGQSAIPFSIVEDDIQQLWIATLSRGIFVFDKNRKLVAHLGLKVPFPSISVNQIIKDIDGGIWAATLSGVAYIPNPAKPEEYKVYDKDEGIADLPLRALVQDRQGNIWVSTFTGIAYLDVNRGRFYNYDYQSGIPMANFEVGAATVSSDGTVYFGSPAGVCMFNPQQFTEQAEAPKVQIVDCERLKSQTGQGLSLTSVISTDDDGTVRLHYDENTFRITFTVANYAQNGNVEYSYMMEGLDDRWYTADADCEVTFRNLEPGKYTFKVRAKLKNQDWENASMAEMLVVVRPPLWLTWWAKLLYAFIVAGIVYWFFRSYKNELQLRSSLEKTQWESRHRQQLNDERLRFFTNITHELRTPLTLIMGPLEDLLADSRLPDVLHKKVDSIHASAERLLNLINEILEFRKTETQNRRLTVAHSDIAAFVRDLGNRFKDLNRNPNVEIKVDVPESPVEVYFDSEVVNTVVNNLMSNAMKYTNSGSIMLSVVNDSNGTVSISVSDTGYGISQKALPHIFDRYYQAKGIHQASGTGIGLALVKSLADLHGARLHVDSVEGEGTVFTFALNADNTYPEALHKEDNKPQAEAPIANVETKDDDADVRPLILVVEDNDDIRQYVDESLSEDYRIIQARNGREGADKAFSEMPDLIVSDIMMPEMDGIEMKRLLKGDIRTSHIPIVLLTAKTSPLDQEEGYDSGADSYLMKPFSARLLNSRIKNILSGRRRLAELILQRNMPEQPMSTPSTNAENTPNEPQPQKDVEGNVVPAPTLSPLDRKFMDKLNNLIDENIAIEDIDIAFMTDRMAMSHSTFYRKVKALTGVSANEYIRKVKLQRAMQLLQTGEHNVTEVSMMTGFNNVGYFRKCFKKEYGITPSEVTIGSTQS